MKLGPRQKQWVKDLRAGYPKAEECLAHSSDNGLTIDGFCCLGVYAHTQNESKWTRFEFSILTFSGAGYYLSKEESELLGLHDTRGELSENVVIDGNEFSSLSSINDEAGKDHAWMADFIEKHADKIFTRSA